MKRFQKIIGMEINTKFVGAVFTERIENTLRVFCFFTNGGTSQFEVAAEDNLDNLQHLHSKLNTDETCSSIIVDEVVQGRVYVRSEDGYWLYTLLSTPGNVLPAFNTNICDLPWKYFWRSQATDVLEYGKPGNPVHCFAIRTQISEDDLKRMAKDFNAFTNPLCAPKKQSPARLCLKVGVALACFGILIALTVFYTSIQNAKKPSLTSVTTKATVETGATGFYLLYNHQISGPYIGKIIVNMNAGGLLNSETMCRPENSTEWVSLATLFPSQPPKKI